MEERKPHFVGKALAAGRDGLRVPVDREHAALPTQGLEDLCRMTAAPKRRIDIVTARFEGQSRERLRNEHRYMLVHFALVPRCLPDARPSGRTTPEIVNSLPIAAPQSFSESSSEDLPPADGSFVNHWSRQRPSSHNSNRLP